MLSMDPKQRALVLACSMAMFAIDLGLFRMRGFSVMIIASVISNVAMTVTIFVAMVFLQNLHQFSPTRAGLAFLAFKGECSRCCLCRS